MEQERIIRTEISAERILVISDIHGSLGLFRELLEKMEYRPGQDALVILGDIVRKGTESIATLRYVMELSKQEQVYVLAGNNDIFVCEAPAKDILSSVRHFGKRALFGEMALALGFPFPETEEETAILQAKAKREFALEFEFLRSLPYILETERFLFTHAGLESENLEQQNREFVTAAVRFHDAVNYTFRKMLLVGHYPVNNFHGNHLSNQPLYHEKCNVLSIDGGNNVNLIGQLNGIILNNKTGEWSSLSADSFPKIPAPCSQRARWGTAVRWPENRVEVLERGEKTSLCRISKTGAVFRIFNEFLYESDGQTYTQNTTDSMLEVTKGETVSLISEGEDCMMILKDGEAGLLFPDQKTASGL